MDLLAALAIFRRTAERESFAAAARDLGLSQATVTRTIQALERHYGVELLRRSTRKTTVTEAGRTLLGDGAALIDAVRALEARVGGGADAALAGRLRITAPSGFGTQVLAPLIARFAEAHRAVAIDLLCTDRYLDLVAENIDLAFRVGLLDDSALLQRAIARLPEELVASPAYLDRHPALTRPADLIDHPFVGLSILRGPAQALCLTSAADGETVVRPDNRMSFDTPLAVRECLLAGGGIGRIHRYLVAADLEAGRLRRALPGWHCPTWTMSAVRTTRASTRVADAFLTFFGTALAGVPGIERA